MIKTHRPLGAFITSWNETSKNDLKKYGFSENGITKKIFENKMVMVHKYKTQHTKKDDTGLPFLDNRNNYTENTYHHLDFYIYNDKLVNTDVYTTEIDSCKKYNN